MFPNAFAGWPDAPKDADLVAVLGKSKRLWDTLLAELTNAGLIASWEWHSYSRNAGWAVRGKRDRRTILYLGPFRGGFRVSFALGGKAMETTRATKFSKSVMAVIEAAPKYAEGFAVRLEVKTLRDLVTIRKIAAIKVDAAGA